MNRRFTRQQANHIKQVIKQIARTSLELEAFEALGRSNGDFIAEPVAQIAEALLKAYEAGYRDARNEK